MDLKRELNLRGGKMDEERLEYTKMNERIDWAIQLIKDKCKKEGIEFDKDILIEAIEVGKCLFVRSEIAYSGKR